MNRLLALGLALVLCLFALPAAYADGGENQVITMEYAPDAYLLTIEDVFRMQVEKELYGGFSLFTVGDDRSAGAQLTGDDKTAYDALVPVVSAIAAGNRESTQLTISQISYCDYNAVIDALLADCAYEMYWYNGCQLSMGSGGFTFKFVPAQAYQGSGDYTVNTTKTSAAATAAANAVDVVKANASKSDYEKLIAYRQYICNAVTYNDAAADSTTNTPYGDPWQLIYVFDGNPDTNVVCEGYSKAFQYLCELTDFNSSEIFCYLVSGYMGDSESSGAHMWNIVTMDDGLNYLVDVTNCDGNSVGSPDKLFLKGYGFKDTASNGAVVHGFSCGYAGQVYYQYDLNLPWGNDVLTISATDYVPGAVHSCEYTWTPGNAKTATHHTLACTCGKTKQEVHMVLSEATCKAAAVCEVCGTYGEKNANNHVNADFTYEVNASDSAKHDKKHACCGAVAETEGHNWAYTASGNAITAKCADCPADGGKVTISKPDDLVYSGSAKEAKVNSTISGVYPDVAYTGSLTDGKPVKAGTYTASITLGGKTVSVEYTITQKALKPTVVVNETDYTYDGTSKEPGVEVMDGAVVVEPYEYRVFYENNINAGTATVRVDDAQEGGNYALEPVTAQFTIKQAKLTDDMVSLAVDSMIHTGSALTPAVTVSSPAKATDYDVSYSDNTAVGTAKVTVTGKNNYTGTVEKTFKITAHEHSWTYSASGNTITATCSGEGSCEVANKTATVTVTGGTYTYDGTAKQVSVTQNPADTFSGVTVTYDAQPLNAGDYTASITLGGVTAKDTLTIEAKPVNPIVSVANSVCTYDGTEKKPEVTLRDEDVVLDPSEYSVSYSDNVQAGNETAKITVSDAAGGNYVVTGMTVTFTIKPAVLTDNMVSLSADFMVHTGSALTPEVTVTGLVKDKDYTVAYSSNVNIGTAKVTVTGKGNYAGTVEKTFKITAHEHSWTYSASGNTITATCSGEGSCEVANKTATVTVTGGTHTYDGTPKQAAVMQNPENMFSGVTVKYDIDTTTYNTAPIDAGVYTVRVMLNDVTATDTMTINPKKIKPTVVLSQTSYTYDGTEKYPTATVKDADKVIHWTEYNERYTDNLNAGTAKFTVGDVDNGNYEIEETTVEFTINPAELTADMVTLYADSMVHTGSALTPEVKVTGLVKDKDYTVAYSDNVNIGTAKVTVAGKGNYAGTVEKTFKITAHEHSWTYSASGNVITATCSGAGICDAGKTATVTVTGGTYTYDGTAKQATVTQEPADTFNDVQMVYTDNKLPVNAGNYTVGVKLGGVTATDTLTINRKPLKPTVTVVVPTKPRVYNGTEWIPDVRVYDGEIWLDASEYRVFYEDNINAGTAKAIVKNASGGNYALEEVEAEFTIEPAELTDDMVSLSASAMEYTGSALMPAVTVSSPATTNDYDVSYSNNTAVGTATVTVTGKNNYTGAVTKTFEITTHVHKWTYSVSGNVITAACACTTEGNKVTVTVAGGTYTYDGAEKQATVTQEPADVFADVAVTYDAQPKNAGSYTAAIALGGVKATAQIVISPKAVTVTAEAKTKVYGEADPALTYQADGLVTGEALTGALAREAGENAGEYAITQGTLTSDNNPNYTIAFTGAKLTIAKKPAAAAPTVTGTYERVGTTYTYTVTAIEGAEYRMDDGAWQGSNVFSGIQPNSKHTFSARIKGSANAETGAEGKTAEITFDRLQGVAAVSITGWTYGQSANIPVPVSETNGTANVTYLYESTDGKNYSSAAAPTNAGSYKVTATFEKTDAYSECTATAEFTIAKAIPTPADVTGLKASYGDTLSSVALPAGWAWKDGSVKVGNVGSNSFDAVYTPADTQNYELLTSDLTVTVDPKEIAADFSAVAASYPYTGQEIKPVVKVADGQNAVPANAYTITYSNNVNVGTAKIMVTDTAGGNYIVTGEKEFAIVKAAAPVVQTASVAVLREIDTTGNEVDLAALLPLNRGETAYSITTSDANAAVKNAAVSAQGKFTFDTTKSDAVSEAVYVIKAVMQNYEDAAITVKISLTDKTPVTVSGAAAASGLTYDGTAKTGYTGTPSAAPYTGAFDVTYTGTQADGTVYGPAAEAPVNAGSYTVTIAVPASAVYAGSTSISFEIAKATVTIKVQDINALAGQAMPALGYEVLGLVGTDALITAPTLSCTPDMSTEGVYPITASGAEVGANYTLAYQAGTLYVLTGGAQSVTTRIDAQGLTQVAAGLVDTAFNTVEKIVEEQTRTLIDGKPDYTKENMAHYDVKLQFSLDGGKTWIDATEVNFPANGLKVKIDYPAGTSKDTHDFIVSHMFTLTSERLGTEAGKTEQPAVTELEDGLEFSVKGLSPISVAWKETKEVQSAIDDLPKTGDNSMLMLWSLLCISALIGCVVISRRREY